MAPAIRVEPPRAPEVARRAPEAPSYTAAPAGRAGSAVLPDADNSLALEVRLIDAARRALAASDPASALAALDRYGRERSSAVLDREARLLRIDALALAGDRAAATALARAYLRELPADAHAPRLRALVARGGQ